MNEERSQGIILKLRDIGEADVLVTFFTDREGLLTMKAPRAKRSKKRFAGLLRSFAKHEITFQRKAHVAPRLLRLEPIVLREELATNLPAFAAASYLAELLIRLTQEGDANLSLFELADSFLSYLPQHSPLSPEAFCRFHLHLFRLLGLAPNWQFCLECGFPVSQDERRFFFDLAQGGLICEHCVPEPDKNFPPLSEKLRLLMMRVQARQPTQAPPYLWRQAISLIDQRILFLLGSPPKSRSFLKEMNGL